MAECAYQQEVYGVQSGSPNRVRGQEESARAGPGAELVLNLEGGPGMRPVLVPGTPRQDRQAMRAIGSAVIAVLSYLVALWLRWWGAVPDVLWMHMAYVLPPAVLGCLIGGSLVHLFGPAQSWSLALYGAFVTSSISVIAAMAGTFTFRVTAIPRLTFALAFFLLWGGLAIFARASARVSRSGAIGSPAPSPAVRSMRAEESRLDRVLPMLRNTGRLTIVNPGVFELVLASAQVREDTYGLALCIEPRALQWPVPLLKRFVDVVVSLVVLVGGLPIWLLVMLAIRLDSPGCVLYRQTRVGQGGRLFEVIKFRTMVVDAEAQSGPVLASADDPRVTRVGRFLRAFRLDEVPQFINVLRGEMSVVGPRPERPEFVEQFRKKIEGYDLRHLVKPGITGLAQIRGNYDTPAEDKLRFDLAYIFLWSPLLELKIMLQTIGTMLTPERARSSRPMAEPPPARAAETSRLASAFQEVAASQDGALESGGGRLVPLRRAAGGAKED